MLIHIDVPSSIRPCFGFFQNEKAVITGDGEEKVQGRHWVRLNSYTVQIRMEPRNSVTRVLDVEVVIAIYFVFWDTQWIIGELLGCLLSSRAIWWDYRLSDRMDPTSNQC